MTAAVIIKGPWVSLAILGDSGSSVPSSNLGGPISTHPRPSASLLDIATEAIALTRTAHSIGKPELVEQMLAAIDRRLRGGVA